MTAYLLEGLHIQNELVAAHAMSTLEHDVVVTRKLLGHVVGVQDGAGSDLLETLRTEHGEVHPGNRQDISGTVRSSSNVLTYASPSTQAIHTLSTTGSNARMARKEGTKVLTDT